MANELTTLANNMSILATPDGIQRYILGTKKNGQPRALYDVIKDCNEIREGKKKKKKKKYKANSLDGNSYAFYLSTSSKKGKKKSKKKKKKNKKDDYWHI